MKKEFLVERQGKQFALYAGLVDLATENGLKSIKTELVQIPSEANNRVAICYATVTMEKDGVERTFTGIGDAAPNNVAPAMQTALIRMAETRSKARALRDATNVGVTAFEELSDVDATDEAPERGYRTSTSNRPTRPAPTARPTAPAFRSAEPKQGASPIPDSLKNPNVIRITATQMEAVRSLCRRKGSDPDALAAERFDAENLSALTSAQGSDLIKSLNQRPALVGAA